MNEAMGVPQQFNLRRMLTEYAAWHAQAVATLKRAVRRRSSNSFSPCSIETIRALPSLPQ
jgi:hypothetical protein